MQTTLIILKPDAVQRGLIGRVISRFEDKGLRIIAARFMTVPADLARRHYAEHEGKPFYEGLIRFITGSPVLVLAVRGLGAIAVCRKLIGATHGAEAEVGTIRGDFGLSGGFNLIHGSDGSESAERELAMWFGADGLTAYGATMDQWVYDPADVK